MCSAFVSLSYLVHVKVCNPFPLKVVNVTFEGLYMEPQSTCIHVVGINDYLKRIGRRSLTKMSTS